MTKKKKKKACSDQTKTLGRKAKNIIMRSQTLKTLIVRSTIRYQSYKCMSLGQIYKNKLCDIMGIS